MDEHDNPNPEAANQAEIAKTLNEVQVLDPELLEHPETRLLVELGAQYGTEVTRDFGTPAEPKWASGEHETGVLMTFHNGGEDGHTSVGPEGVGVPRNVLMIAKAVNEAAGREVFDPMMRATAFYSAEAHDSQQLCGRSLLPEGQGEGRGDERLSAQDARERYQEAGGDENTGNLIHDAVMVTAWNPNTGAQNVQYDAWRADPDNPEATRAILVQELVAAADLLSSVSERGPLGAIEYSFESLCFNQNNQAVQEHLRTQGIDPDSITSMEQFVDVVGDDPALRESFAKLIAGQKAFFTTYLKYSDEAIRAACGRGIDDLFPLRQRNADILEQFAEGLENGTETPRSVWEKARALAGYDDSHVAAESMPV
jgi:hypothetical protein